ncbi:DUF6005 family protein [Paenibacillus sp. KN14-4R]|uniref:DUF6005 family protein n=1 Tax=Paenibacillus sp. KN14-4R TaxID=3445773 RepID=UPI003FA1693B
MHEFSQIHCLIDCLTDVFKDRLDQRPLYFGVWEESINIEDGKVSYYSIKSSYEWLINQFEFLYGKRIIEWFRYITLEDNYPILLGLAENCKRDNYSIIIMVDLFYLPYEKKNFNKNHCPHYIWINDFQAGQWHINDPYFGYRGTVTDEILRKAFYRKQMGSGFLVENLWEFKNPTSEKIIQLFKQSIILNSSSIGNSMLSLIKDIRLNSHCIENIRLLIASIEQLGVVINRKRSLLYAYTLVAEKVGNINGVEGFKAELNRLSSAWVSFGLIVMRKATKNDWEEIDNLEEKIVGLCKIEIEIKEILWGLYDLWENRTMTTQK